jgi:serine-type D-Ala-D-Ala endopeptidase (penicillin-binding protein 7)
MKNSEKFLFAIVVIGAALFSRLAYPTIAAFPGRATATQIGSVSGGNNPPFMALPSLATTSPSFSVSANAGIASADASGGVAQNASSGATSTFFIQTGTNPAPTLNVEGDLVADPVTGAIFTSLNPDTRWPTASLTKWMAATIIFDNLSTSTEITITPQMFSVDPEEATLVVGDTYTVEDLLHLMLMPSSNVAVQAMADFYGLPAFMQAMNARAAAWGMNNTYFDDPSGISAANESTPHDLMILAEHVYADYPGILAITRTPQVYITEQNTGRKVLVKSINEFAGESDFIGGKTGHTTEAQGNLLSLFQYDGHAVLVLVLGTANRFDDSEALYSWFKANYK